MHSHICVHYSVGVLQVDYMEPWVERLTLGEIPRFDSPKSIFLGRVMGKTNTDRHFVYNHLYSSKAQTDFIFKATICNFWDFGHWRTLFFFFFLMDSSWSEGVD